jgi:hypothetical protein
MNGSIIRHVSFERARLYRLRRNSILDSVLKGLGFSRADKANQINLGFSPRRMYFEKLTGMQPFFRSLFRSLKN